VGSQDVDPEDLEPDGEFAVSENKEEGEASMMVFVKEYFASILKPFAHHLDELHGSVDRLRDCLEETDGKVLHNTFMLDQQADAIRELRNELTSVNDLATVTETSLKKTIMEQHELRKDHGSTKAELSDVAARLAITSEAEKKMRDESENIKKSVAQIKKGLARTDQNIAENIEVTVDELVSGVSSLKSASEETIRDLGDVKKFGQSTHQNFVGFVKGSELQKAKDEKQFSNINASISDLGEILKDTNHRLQTQTEHLKTANSVLRPLKARAEQMDTDLQSLKARAETLSKELSEEQKNCEKATAAINKLTEKFGENEDNAKKAPNIFELVQNLTQSVSRNSVTINNLEETGKKQHEQLVAGDLRANLLERSHRRLQQHTIILEDKVGVDNPLVVEKSLSTQVVASPEVRKDVEKSGKVNNTDDVRSVQKGDIPMSVQRVISKWSLTVRQKAAMSMLDTHTKDIQSTNAQLRKTAEELEAACARVDTLESELVATNNKVNLLHAGLDVTQEYWSGLRKGLREMKRSVVDENEMLPPSAGRVNLPSISRSSMPGSPGTMSAR